MQQYVLKLQAFGIRVDFKWRFTPRSGEGSLLDVPSFFRNNSGVLHAAIHKTAIAVDNVLETAVATKGRFLPTVA